VAPVENGEWYLLVSNAFGKDKAAHTGTVHFLDHPFTPIPFGKDIYASFGDEFAVPVLGNFDPPVTGGGSATPIGVTNLDNPYDINVDGRVDALDALILINDINANGQRDLTYGTFQAPFLDVTRDGAVSAADVLGVINVVNTAIAGNAGGEGEAAAFIEVDLSAAVAPAVTSTVAVADSLAGVQYAGLLVEPLSASPVAAVPSAAAQVDQYFAQGDDAADDLSVYSTDLADAALARTVPSVRRASGEGVADLELDGVLADLAADQDRSQETSADGFFTRLGRFFRRLA
jgi:hypothetical protein